MNSAVKGGDVKGLKFRAITVNEGNMGQTVILYRELELFHTTETEKAQARQATSKSD